MDETTGTTISRIRKLLYEALKDSPQSTAQLVEALELIDSLEGKRASGGWGKTKRSIRGYSVEKFQGHDVLCEHREGGQNPYRCRREMYDTVVAALDGVREPIRYDEILACVTKSLKSKPPDYLLRVCLRFWQSGDTQIVTKSGPRYAPSSPDAFAKQAAAAWEKAKQNN